VIVIIQPICPGLKEVFLLLFLHQSREGVMEEIHDAEEQRHDRRASEPLMALPSKKKMTRRSRRSARREERRRNTLTPLLAVVVGKRATHFLFFFLLLKLERERDERAEKRERKRKPKEEEANQRIDLLSLSLSLGTTRAVVRDKVLNTKHTFLSPLFCALLCCKKQKISNPKPSKSETQPSREAPHSLFCF